MSFLGGNMFILGANMYH